MKKCAVIGHFGFGTESLDGQTVKTKVLTDALCKHFGKQNVLQLDTHNWKKRPLRFLWNVVTTAWKAENILILPAHNGLCVFTPLLWMARKIFPDCKLHYSVIGGWLPALLEKKRILKKLLKTFHSIYVETQTMKLALEKQGFQNVYVVPNCKELTVLSPDELIYDHKEPYKLCTFSRVMREKGIEDAVQAVKTANAHLGRTAYILDIYGQIDPAQIQWFDELQSNFPDAITYKGAIPYDRSVEVLKNYFALLFPTYYDGEGFAGTLLDAMASGVPVIASDWKYNSEIVKDGKTGKLFPAQDSEALVKNLIYAMQHLKEWNTMKYNCLEEAKQYSPERVIEIVIRQIEDNVK